MRKDNIIYRGLRKIYHISPFYKGKKEETYHGLNKEEFLDLLLSYDVISFDIFDTLLTRILYQPDDLFHVMEKKLNDCDFFKKRKEAERYANETLKKDVNLEEIYACYQKLYQTDPKEIKKMEEDLELSFCIPRYDMLDIINTLIKQKKTVIFTSDMYLTKDIIEKMLAKCGYKKYDKLYLSNDINKRKDRKDMWPYLLEEYKNKTIIHVGDNENSDYLYPREFGIDSIKIESSRELFSHLAMSKHIQEFLQKENISNSLYLGLLINKTMFNSPFSNLKINTLSSFGYSFHAPILERYLNFIENESKENSTLLFLAREGYYLQKLYQEHCKIKKIEEKENLYFLASRKAVTTANIEKKEDILSLLENEFNGTVKDFYKQVLEVDYEEKNEKLHLPEEKEKVLKHLDQYQDKILKTVSQEKENYLHYIENTVKNYQKKNLTIIDLGYSGTIQYQLTKLLRKEIKGLYVTNSKNVKRYSKKSELSFLFDIKDCSEYEKIYHYSLILEFFLSAPFGQLLKFEKKGKKVIPVYNEEVLDEKKKKSLDVIYQSVIEYFKDIKKIEEIYPFQPDKELLCRVYVCLVEENLLTREVKDQFDFVDAFCSSGVRNVFKIISRY